MAGIGDDAAAAGMELVPSSGADGKVWQGWQWINKTRDYIAQKAVLKTAVTTVGSALIGAVSAAAARAAIGLAAMSQAADANSLAQRDAAGNLVMTTGFFAGGTGPNANHGATRGYVDSSVGGIDLSSRVAKSGDTMSGNLFLPASSAATSGYTIAYVNGDGRVSRGASSERYKKFVSDVLPSSLGNLFPAFKRWQMRNGDGVWRYGHTAEQLAADPATEPFVIYRRHIEDDGTAPHLERDEHGNPIPESIDFIGLHAAQIAQINERLTALETGE